MNIEKLTPNEIMSELRRLQSAARDAETELFLWCWEIENKRGDFWKTQGVVSFVGWITTHQVCEPMQYTEFAAGMQKIADSDSDARDLGANTVRTLGRYGGSRVSADDMKTLKGLTESFEGVHDRKPGEQTAKDWLKRISPKLPKVVGQHTKIGQLTAELQAAKTEIRTLKRENKRLRAQLDKLTPKSNGRKGKPGDSAHPN